MANKKQAQRGYDYSLLIPTLMLLGLGLVTIYSASSLLAAHKLGDSYYFLKKQGVFCLLGLCLLIFCQKHSLPLLPEADLSPAFSEPHPSGLSPHPRDGREDWWGHALVALCGFLFSAF
jgi:hypothetical protein